MTTQTLPEIAAEMGHEAAANLGSPIRRRLSRGLRLVMLDTLRRRQLSLIRPDVRPSPKEVRIIRRDFAVPTGAKQIEDSRVIRGQVFFVVRLIWPKSGQMRIFERPDGDGVVVTIVNQE